MIRASELSVKTCCQLWEDSDTPPFNVRSAPCHRTAPEKASERTDNSPRKAADEHQRDWLQPLPKLKILLAPFLPCTSRRLKNHRRRLEGLRQGPSTLVVPGLTWECATDTSEDEKRPSLLEVTSMREAGWLLVTSGLTS